MIAAAAAAAFRLGLSRLLPLFAAFAREGDEAGPGKGRPAANARRRAAAGSDSGRAGASTAGTSPHGAASRPSESEPEPATRRELAASDAQLFARIAAGDHAALAGLYDRYGRFVFSLALRTLRDRNEAEDALQEIFIKVWSRADQFDPRRGSALSWLGTLARHHAIDRVRAAGSRPSLAPATTTTTDGDERDAAPDDARHRPEARTILDEDREAVRKGLGALPAEQRVLLELAYFDGLSQSEISEHVSAPLGTVKTRMRAGLKSLRESLAVRFEGEEGRS
jgi:RNA polymerase sigma-70 factor (ECF subfamily)